MWAAFFTVAKQHNLTYAVLLAIRRQAWLQHLMSMLQQHLYMQTGLLSTPCKALLAGRMLMAIAYPLSRAGTNCPNRKAITRAAPLLSNVPCCRRFFKNRDSRNRVPVIPATKPAPSNAHIQTHIQWHMTHIQSMPYCPLTCSEGIVWHTGDESCCCVSVWAD